jgi:ribonuclease HI
MPYYAVAAGHQIGIFLTWAETQTQIKGYKGAVYKKFPSEAEAQTFIDINQSTQSLNTDTPTTTTNFDYYVYTDGSCINNGKPNAKAGMGVYFGPDDPRNVSRSITGKQSNNTGELTALIAAHHLIKADATAGKRIAVISDSKYGIRCATSYGKKCAASDWAEDVPNKDLVKLAYDLYSASPNITLIHVLAHTHKTDIHSVGNAEADRLANAAVGLTEKEKAPDNKLYLNVPYAQKDAAKAQGARWDPKKKKWYVFTDSEHAAALQTQFP